jgi:hypothetical protein
MPVGAGDQCSGEMFCIASVSFRADALKRFCKEFHVYIKNAKVYIVNIVQRKRGTVRFNFEWDPFKATANEKI